MNHNYRLGDAMNAPGWPEGEPATLAPLPRRPLVSLVVPCKNNAVYLVETLQSALTQDYEPLEVVVVDGASTDGTLEILRRYAKDSRVRWISEPDSGAYEAWNKGFHLARGELVGIQTDLYLPGAIKTIVAEFESDPSLALVGGWVQIIDVNGKPTGELSMLEPETRDYVLEDILRFKKLTKYHSTLMRRDVLVAIGGFDVAGTGDHSGSYLGVHYMLEASRLGGRARAIPEVLASFRVHPGQVSQRPGLLTGAYLARRYGSKMLAKRYKDHLTPKQTRLLRRSGYRFLLAHTARRSLDPRRAIPAAVGYIWFGGGPHVIGYVVRKLFSVTKPSPPNTRHEEAQQ